MVFTPVQLHPPPELCSFQRGCFCLGEGRRTQAPSSDRANAQAVSEPEHRWQEAIDQHLARSKAANQAQAAPVSSGVARPGAEQAQPQQGSQAADAAKASLF